MKISTQMKAEITAAMKAKNYMHRQKNGVDQYVHKGFKEGIELKGDKIDAFVINDDMEEVYGLQLIGNESRDRIKELQKILNVETEQKYYLREKPTVPELKNEIVPVQLDTWELSNELIQNHPGTILLLIAMQDTPEAAIKTRKGPKGTVLKYVETGYMTFCLNYASLMNWNFEILESETDMIEEKMHISVLGRVTMTTTDNIIIFKEAWGSQVLKAGMEMGDARKAAASDAMKKAASMYGIAAKVYAGVQ